MISVRQVEDERCDLVRTILEALPEWFGDVAAREEYIVEARTMPTWVATQDGEDVGVLLMRRHFAETAEIHLLAAMPQWHRRGVGTALVRKVEQDVAADGAALLEVKTVPASHPDPYYARTRKFYAAMGFSPLEVISELWPPHGFLLLVKPLG